jgi:hypothetical protein
MLNPLLHFGRKAALRLAAVVFAAASLSGCQSIDANNAQLRVIDAAPDAGAIDAYQNKTGLAYNLSFGNETSYVAMTPGSYTLSADKASTHQMLVTTTSTLQAGHQYTEIIGNIAADLQQTLLQDKTTPAAAGQIEFRLVNQATHSGPVDIYLVASGGRPTPLVTDLSFGKNSGYLGVPAGTYAIDIVPTGTVLVSSTVTLQSGSQTEYLSGAVRTFILIDEETLGAQKSSLSTGVQAIPLQDADAQ